MAACNRGGCSQVDSENPAGPIEPVPSSPANLAYAVEGSTTVVSWDAVDGADHYNIYHDDFHDSSCRVRSGGASFCEELAANITDTAYTHTDPDPDTNYYWVAACNRGGCSQVDSENPAGPIEPVPSSPANLAYAVEASTTVVSWDAVDGADHYNIYHDDFHDSSCRLNPWAMRRWRGTGHQHHRHRLHPHRPRPRRQLLLGDRLQPRRMLADRQREPGNAPRGPLTLSGPRFGVTDQTIYDCARI